jgi:hypothetical protein
MALTVTDRGVGARNTGGETTYAISPSGNFAAGLAVLFVAYDNSGTNGADPYVSIADSLGNTWTSVKNGLQDPGAASAGCTLRAFTTAQNIGTLTTGTTITVTFGATTVARAYALYEVNGASTPIYIGGVVLNVASTSYGFFAPTVDALAGEVLLAATALESDGAITADSDSTSGSWSTAQTAAAASGLTGMRISAQSKVVSGIGEQKYNPSWSGNLDSVAMVLVVREGAGLGIQVAQQSVVAWVGNDPNLVVEQCSTVVWVNADAQAAGATSISVGNVVTAQSKTNSTTVNGTTVIDVDAGQLIVLIAASDNEDTTDGETSLHSTLTVDGHSATKLKEWTNTVGGASGDGTTVSVWMLVAPADIPSGATVLKTFNVGRDAKAITGYVFDVPSIAPLTLDGTSTLSADAAQPPSMSATATDSVYHLWVRGIALEGDDVTLGVLYTTPGWIAFDGIGTSTGGATTNQSVRGEWKISEGTASGNTKPALMASADSANVIVGIRLTAITYSASVAVMAPNPVFDGDATFTAGGASFTGSVAVVAPNPTFASSSTFVAPTYSATISVESPNPTYSASATFVAPVYSATIAVEPASPAFAATATFGNLTFTGIVSVSAPSPTFLGTGTTALPTYSAVITVTHTGPVFSGTVDSSVPTFTGSVSTAAPGPDFNSVGDTAPPVFSAVITVSVPLVEFTATAEHDLPVYLADVTVVAPSTEIKSVGDTALPVYTATVSVTTPSPFFAAVVQYLPVGGAITGTLRFYPIIQGTLRFYPLNAGTLTTHSTITGVLRFYPVNTGSLKISPSTDGGLGVEP